MGFFSKIKEGLTKTRKAMAETLGNVFSGFSNLDDDFYDRLEESLILADVGMDVALDATEKLRRRAYDDRLLTADQVKGALREILAEKLEVGDSRLDLSTQPSVILVIGVNGVGKTTSIGKMAHQLKKQGKKVLLCAGDTFRAAAADQLEIWADRAGVDIVRQNEGADPGAVLFDALAAAKARRSDVVLVDTAGRLHNKANLMKELAKLRKIIDRELPGAAKETLLVLDATTGQNGLIQARQFKETAGLTGIVLTKLDGTAKGGIVIAIAQELQVPVKFVGLGEGIGDLAPFDPERPDLPAAVTEQVEIALKYEGYIARQRRQVEEMRKMESHPLPPDLDYLAIPVLRLEARQKLDKIRPLNLGQASRISGVSPADMAALMIYLENRG